MRIYKKVLTESTNNLLMADYNKSLSQECWRVSALTWSPSLLHGIVGTVSMRVLGDELKHLVLNDLSPNLPPVKKHIVQIYNWHSMSGIAPHDDADRGFGATVYLNPHWDVSWGGNFNWRIKNTDNINSIVPEFNTMVVNDEKETHWVNSISALCSTPRVTLQIWGDLE